MSKAVSYIIWMYHIIIDYVETKIDCLVVYRLSIYGANCPLVPLSVFVLFIRCLQLVQFEFIFDLTTSSILWLSKIIWSIIEEEDIRSINHGEMPIWVYFNFTLYRQVSIDLCQHFCCSRKHLISLCACVYRYVCTWKSIINELAIVFISFSFFYLSLVVN